MNWRFDDPRWRKQSFLNRRGKRNLAGVFILAVAFLIAAVSCSRSSVDEVGAVVESFRVAFKHKRYEEIYSNGSDELRRRISEERFTQMLKEVNAQLGEIVVSEPLGQIRKLTINGWRWTLSYRVRFDRGRGIERFVILREGKSLKLGGYHISSDDLKGPQP